MFFEFPYQKVGFSSKEWSLIPSGVKRIIRDYYLNGMDQIELEKYEYLKTDFSIRRAINKYRLRARPVLIVRAQDVSLV